MDKPIYNHVSGNLDAPEKTDSPDVSAAGGDTAATQQRARTRGSGVRRAAEGQRVLARRAAAWHGAPRSRLARRGVL